MYEVMLICVFGRWLNLFPFITIADLFEFISTYFLLLPFSLFSYFLLDLKDAFLLLNPTCLESSRLHFYSSLESLSSFWHALYMFPAESKDTQYVFLF